MVGRLHFAVVGGWETQCQDLGEMEMGSEEEAFPICKVGEK